MEFTQDICSETPIPNEDVSDACLIRKPVKRPLADCMRKIYDRKDKAHPCLVITTS